MSSLTEKKLLQQTKFPPSFSKKVDMTRVNLAVLKSWITTEITKYLGHEDDVVSETAAAYLEGVKHPNIKQLQISISGFLGKNTAKFCSELWDLCLSAQENPQGVPTKLLEAKKEELKNQKLEDEKSSRARQERGEASRRGSQRHRGPPQSDSRGFRPRREHDSYMPGRREFGGRNGRSRSPARTRSRSPYRSRSPARHQRHDDGHNRGRSFSPRRRYRSRSPQGRRGGRRRRGISRTPSYSPSYSSRSRSPAARRRERYRSSDRSRSPDTHRRTGRDRSRSPPSGGSRPRRRRSVSSDESGRDSRRRPSPRRRSSTPPRRLRDRRESHSPGAGRRPGSRPGDGGSPRRSSSPSD